ncbi:hypothetical protein [Lacticaseibacillus daqingensis]|uniref:hypothetical protein n=1 Tax=Lacticaseibacillus daqingensis TaxID=2486014 RepID=UPI000F779DC6|nr:hypothetical protein [Lacticaseibacillus daqingensis]
MSEQIWPTQVQVVHARRQPGDGTALLARVDELPETTLEALGADLVCAVPIAHAVYGSLVLDGRGRAFVLKIRPHTLWRRLNQVPPTVAAYLATVATQVYETQFRARPWRRQPPMIAHLSQYYFSLGGTGQRHSPAIIAGHALLTCDALAPGRFRFVVGRGAHRWTLDLAFGTMAPAYFRPLKDYYRAVMATAFATLAPVYSQFLYDSQPVRSTFGVTKNQRALGTVAPAPDFAGVLQLAVAAHGLELVRLVFDLTTVQVEERVLTARLAQALSTTQGLDALGPL